jgi:hypothetical protein
MRPELNCVLARIADFEAYGLSKWLKETKTLSLSHA